MVSHRITEAGGSWHEVVRERGGCFGQKCHHFYSEPPVRQMAMPMRIVGNLIFTYQQTVAILICNGTQGAAKRRRMI